MLNSPHSIDGTRVLAPALTSVSWDSTDVAAAAARLLVERASTRARPAPARTASAA